METEYGRELPPGGGEKVEWREDAEFMQVVKREGKGYKAGRRE